MAFLDNSGDIILDAVLTDTGRHRLARGDGSFRIAKFALGDDEINYQLYDKNNASGSAYYDLSILQTPVLEAFTNNTSLMKSKLISIPRTNLLYLPVIKQVTFDGIGSPYTRLGDGKSYVILVDNDTEDNIIAAEDTAPNGVIFGSRPQTDGSYIATHQGLDTTEIPRTFPLDADLVETQYIVEIDNRLGQLVSGPKDTSTAAKVSFIDDDQIASYYLTLNTDTQFVKTFSNPTKVTQGPTAVAGPRGTRLLFKIKSSIDLNSSTFLFTQLGGTITHTDLGMGSGNFYFIDSTVRISGATTGYRLDIPIRFLKSI
jgi:hypothetical protein